MGEEKQDTEEIKREGNPFLRQVSLLLLFVQTVVC